MLEDELDANSYGAMVAFVRVFFMFPRQFVSGLTLASGQ